MKPPGQPTNWVTPQEAPALSPSPEKVPGTPLLKTLFRLQWPIPGP